MKSLTIYGKSEQKQYNGYQLMPIRLKNTDGEILKMPYTIDGITINITEDEKGFSVKGTNTASDYTDFYITTPNEFSLEAGAYTRSGKGFTKDIRIITGGGNSSGGCLPYLEATSDFVKTDTVEAGKTGNHILRISENATINTTVYFQLEKGSVAHPWEPYTGGQPSPSPDYPQEIVSAGMKWSTGAQLLDFSKAEYVTHNGITAELLSDGSLKIKGVPNRTYAQALKLDLTLANGEYYITGGEIGPGMAYAQINTIDTSGHVEYITNKKFIIDETITRCTFVIQNSNYTDYVDYIIYPMLNKGDKPLPWEPYTGGVPEPYGDKIEVEMRGKNLFDAEYKHNHIDIGHYFNTGERTAVGMDVLKLLEYDGSTGRNYYVYPISPNTGYVVSFGGNISNNMYVGLANSSGIGTRDILVFSWQTDISFTTGDDEIYLVLNTDGTSNVMLSTGAESVPYEPYHTPQSMSIATPNGLPGIPVSSGGNYTDDTGQQWICDEIDFGRGVYVQRINIVTADGENTKFNQQGSYCNLDLRKLPKCKYINTYNERVLCLSNITSEPWLFNKDYAFLYLVKRDYAELLNNAAKEHPAIIAYPLATPIETPLTPDQLVTYKALHTYKGTTVVDNDSGAGMRVSYST